MKKLVLQDNVIFEVDRYIRQYNEYFHRLYSDTGIFDLEQILASYDTEANNRREEISILIEKHFSDEIVYGRTGQNTLFLPWRSKTLWISWVDE